MQHRTWTASWTRILDLFLHLRLAFEIFLVCCKSILREQYGLVPIYGAIRTPAMLNRAER